MPREVSFAMTNANADNRSFDILRDTFNLICDPADWKGPIDCIVPCWMLGVVNEAIKFMTASQPIAYMVPGRSDDVIQVKAAGYRAATGEH